MDYKYNNKYFKDTGLIFLIGLILTAVGAILFITFAVMYGNIFAPLFMIGPVLVIGVILMIFAKGGTLSDSEYDVQTKKLSERLQERAMQKLNLEDRHIKMLAPITFTQYEFKDDPAKYKIKKGADGQIRSNYYVSAIFLFGQQQFYVYGNRLSLTDENEPNTDFNYTYKYSDLTAVELKDEKFTIKIKEKDLEIKYTTFNLLMDNSVILSIPSQSDAITDQKVIDMNKLIVKMRAKQEENK